MARFAGMERQGDAWDQKPKLRKIFGMTNSDLDSEYSNIPGTRSRIYCDVWAISITGISGEPPPGPRLAAW